MNNKNHIYKSISIIMSFVISLSIIFALPAPILAEDNLKPAITIGSSEGDVGENITVQVNMQNPNGMAGGSFNIVYDSRFILPVDVKAGDILKNASFIANPDYITNGLNAVRVVWAGSRGITQGGVLCTINFKLLENGNSDLTLKDLSIKNANLTAMNINSVNGNIKVGNGITVINNTGGGSNPAVAPSQGSAPAGGGGGGGGPMPAVTPPVILPPSVGNQTPVNRAVISEEAIDKQVTSTPEGKIVETYTLKEEVKAEIAKAITEGKNSIQITVAPTTLADKTVVDIPGSIMQSSTGMGVKIAAANAVLELPKNIVDAFAKANKELAITIEKGIAAESAAQMTGVQGTEGASVLGTPIAINTEIKGNTTVTLPLTGINIPRDPATQENFLKTLAIFAVHSDGGKQVIPASIIKDTSGNPVQISFSVDKFSTFAIIQVPASIASLNDITNNWAEANIKKLVLNGAIKGYTDGGFRPGSNITRAEFATVLVKGFKLVPKSGKVFIDTIDSWAKDNISIAASYGIINGYSYSSFGPNDPITREQMAVMVVKAANLNKSSLVKTFTDSMFISKWATDAVDAASANGIISGYPDNRFNPQGNATRAEAVTVIAKALKL